MVFRLSSLVWQPAIALGVIIEIPLGLEGKVLQASALTEVDKEELVHLLKAEAHRNWDREEPILTLRKTGLSVIGRLVIQGPRKRILEADTKTGR